jgi:hypothetical protein
MGEIFLSVRFFFSASSLVRISHRNPTSSVILSAAKDLIWSIPYDEHSAKSFGFFKRSG